MVPSPLTVHLCSLKNLTERSTLVCLRPFILLFNLALLVALLWKAINITSSLQCWFLLSCFPLIFFSLLKNIIVFLCPLTEATNHISIYHSPFHCWFSVRGKLQSQHFGAQSMYQFLWRHKTILWFGLILFSFPSYFHLSVTSLAGIGYGAGIGTKLSTISTYSFFQLEKANH